ncbi:MAG: Rieske 2Fe-2S domain-containing protein [Alphaproteobacteria bacterium]|nr:Rieske 2Fe-2S domain-containing protein [Alphaproteobacteria bacterium]
MSAVAVDADAIPDLGVAVIVHGEDRIAVFRAGEAYYAIDDVCPHAGGSFAQGPFDGRIASCPLHRFQVDVTTGRSTTNAFLRVRTFRVERDGASLRILV